MHPAVNSVVKAKNFNAVFLKLTKIKSECISSEDKMVQ